MTLLGGIMLVFWLGAMLGLFVGALCACPKDDDSWRKPR
jgi:hypothetical protein